MDVILLEKVHNVGKLGQTAKVKAGFARNYLIPNKKAVSATKENLAAFEAKRAELERRETELLALAQQRAAELSGLAITIQMKAGEEGKLFGSLSVRDIVEAIEKEGRKVEKREIRLPEGPIRLLGEYTIDLHLHSDVIASIKLNVTPL